MAKFQPGRSGNPRGRPAGTQNKFSGELKEMILTALSNAGGVAYLTKQATESPGHLLTLVGKVLPLQVTGENGKPLIPAGGVQIVFTQQPGAENRT
jgi:hypothetical protein